MLKRLSILFVLAACSLTAVGETLRGVATNGTTRTPAAGEEVILLRLDKGMNEVARTRTNVKGEFRFDLGSDTTSMHLVRIRHQDVNYNEPVPPGTTSVQLQIYNAKARVSEIKLLDYSQVFQAKDNVAQVVEVFRLSNTSNPALTQPNFEFYLPEGAQITAGEAVTNDIPIKSAPVPRPEKNKYAFLYPVRPGETHFEVVYRMPYTGNLKIVPRLEMLPGRFYVVTPKSMQFSANSGAGFQSMDRWPVDPTIKPVDTHAVDSPQSGTQIAFEISGSGMLAQDEPTPQASAPADSRPGGGLGVPNEKPDPLYSAQWLLLGILVLFLTGGAVFVYISNKPPIAAVAGPAAKPGDRKSMLLDAMKDEIFQLETDRLQGKISQQEYEAAKAALDKTLQRAIRRQS